MGVGLDAGIAYNLWVIEDARPGGLYVGATLLRNASGAYVLMAGNGHTGSNRFRMGGASHYLTGFQTIPSLSRTPEAAVRWAPAFGVRLISVKCKSRSQGSKLTGAGNVRPQDTLAKCRLARQSNERAGMWRTRAPDKSSILKVMAGIEGLASGSSPREGVHPRVPPARGPSRSAARFLPSA